MIFCRRQLFVSGEACYTDFMQIIFVRHQEWASLRETVQLFSGDVSRETYGFSYQPFARSQAYAAEQTITLALSRPLAGEVLRREATDGDVTVTCALPGTTFQLVQTVPALEARRELKRQLYFALSELTGITWPWGSLTGVRPTQVAAGLLDRWGGATARVRTDLIQRLGVSPAKADKVIPIAQTEQALLAQLPPDQYLVYVGVPFCPGRCSYCSFISQDAQHYKTGLSAYTDALIQEITTTMRGLKKPVSALYLGGGTPTSLAAPDLDRLLACIRQEIALTPEAEITVEAGRPDTLDRNKLSLLQAYGVDRICINPQTMHNQTLARVGRHHSVEQVLEIYDLARSMGFQDINMDLILGLPGETCDDFQQSVEALLTLAPDAITLHSLALKHGAWLTVPEAAALLLPDSDWAHTLATAECALEEAGYRPYYLYRQKQVRAGLENTGYAQAGKTCLYNVGMMSDQRNVIGFGSGASSKRLGSQKLERLINSKSLGDYMARAGEWSAKKLAFFGQ